jgi:hypothetical protein
MRYAKPQIKRRIRGSAYRHILDIFAALQRICLESFSSSGSIGNPDTDDISKFASCLLSNRLDREVKVLMLFVRLLLIPFVVRVVGVDFFGEEKMTFVEKS